MMGILQALRVRLDRGAARLGRVGARAVFLAGAGSAAAQEPGGRLVLQDFESAKPGALAPISTWAWPAQLQAEAGSYSSREICVDDSSGNRYLEVWVSPDLPSGSFHFPFETHILYNTGVSLFEPTADVLRFRYRVLEGQFGLTVGGATVYFGNSDVAATPQILTPSDEWMTAEFRLDRELVRTYRRAGFSAQATAIHYFRWIQEPLSFLLLPAESAGTIQIDDIELLSLGYGRPFPSFEMDGVDLVGEPAWFPSGDLSKAFTFTHFPDDFRRSHTGEFLNWPPALLTSVPDAGAREGFCLEARLTGKEERSFVGLHLPGQAGANGAALRLKMEHSKAFAQHSLDIVAYVVPAPERENFPWNTLGTPPDGAIQEGFDYCLSQVATVGLNYAFYHTRRIVPDGEWTTLLLPWSDFAAAYGSGSLKANHLEQLPMAGEDLLFFGLVPSFRQRTGQTRLFVDEIQLVQTAGLDAELRSYAQPSGPGDREPPTVSLTAMEMEVPGGFYVEAVFSEPVEGLERDDFSCENGWVTGLSGEGTRYVATVVAESTKPVALRLPPWSARDAAGNGNLVSSQLHLEHLRRQSPVILAMRLEEVSTAAPVRLRFPRVCAEPLVLLTPEYGRGQPPVIARVDELTPEGCVLWLQRLDGIEATAGGIGLHVVVLEAGLWPGTAGAAGLEARRRTVNVTNRIQKWNTEPVTPLQSYVIPTILGQVFGPVENAWSVFWACGASRVDPPSASFIGIGKHVGEDPDFFRGPETVGYAVVESGAHDFGVFRCETGTGPDLVRHVNGPGVFLYNYEGDFGPDAVVTLAPAGMDSHEGYWPVLPPGAVDPVGKTLRVAVDEDALLDAERNHTTEQLAWALWERVAGREDGMAPVPVLTTERAVIGESFVVRVFFSEPVEGVGPEDFVIANGRAIQFGAEERGYRLTVAPLEEGEVRVAAAEDSVVDSEGLGNIASATLSVEFVRPPGPPAVWTGVVPASTTGPTVVALPAGFENPVVLATVETRAGMPPLAVMVQEVFSQKFSLRLVRLDKNSAVVQGIAVHFVVVEEGRYEREQNGVAMEARRVAVSDVDRASATRDTWQGLSGDWGAGFLRPVILGQVAADPDQRWSQFWASASATQHPPSAVSARIGRHVGEDPDIVREHAELHVIVLEEGFGWLGGLPYEAGVGADVVQGMGDAPPYFYPLRETVPDPVAVVLAPAGLDNLNGHVPVLFGEGAVSSQVLAMAVDEDQLKDKERKHAAEQLAWLVVGAPIGPLEPEIALQRERGAARDRGLGSETTARGIPVWRGQFDPMREWGSIAAGEPPGADWELWVSRDLQRWERTVSTLRSAASTPVGEGQREFRLNGSFPGEWKQGYFRWRKIGSLEGAAGR